MNLRSVSGHTAGTSSCRTLYGTWKLPMQSLKNPPSTSTSPAPPNGHVAAPTPPLPPRTVPNAAKPRHRSLRMQYRFVRVVTYASWLFIRLTIWQVVLKRYFPERVERGNLERWKKYARQFRGI